MLDVAADVAGHRHCHLHGESLLVDSP